MLSARDFYRLEKLSSQGKVKSSEGMSLTEKLIRSLDTLNGPCSVNKISKPLASETSNQLNEKSNTKKKRRRRKRKFSGNDGSFATDIGCSKTRDLESSLNTADLTSESDQEFQNLHPKKQKCDLKQVLDSNTIAGKDCIQSPKNGLLNAPFRSETLSVSSKQITSSLNPLKQGEQLLKEILEPIALEEFFRVNYQKTPLHVKRSSSKCGEWLNYSLVKKLVDKEFLFFGQHVDLIEDKTLKHEIVNPPGRAFAGTVWEHYSQGKGIRFHNLQTFSRRLRFRVGLLQEYFGCNFTVTAYLLSSKPTELSFNQLDHDLFILQQEGSQKFQISSNKTNLKGGNKNVSLVKLKPGDLLYIPKGFAHTISHDNSKNKHTLHLCISFNQKYNWGDYLSELLPIMMKNVVENDPEFNKPLPLNSFKHLGIFFNKDAANIHAIEFEKEFRVQTIQLLKRLVNKIEQRQTFPIRKSKTVTLSNQEKHQSSFTPYSLSTLTMKSESTGKEMNTTKQQPNPYDNLFIQSIDPLYLAIDKIMLKIMRESCAPELSEDELIRSIFKQGSDKSNQLTIHSKIRLIRSTAIRLMLTYFENKESNAIADNNTSNRQHSMIPSFMVYHSLNNQGNNTDSNANVGIGFHKKFLIALSHLIRKYPMFIPIRCLPLEKHTDCLNVAITFYKLGFIITEHKMHQINDDGVENTTGEANVDYVNVSDAHHDSGSEMGEIPKDPSSLVKNINGKRINRGLTSLEGVKDNQCSIDFNDEDNLTDDEDDDCIITEN
uniref:Bifunctional lysine-specific demethylase and histidyl-hydroxylase n=2 Tax=Schistosoma mansoni TaxID=6183 RepID=A0A5K4F8J6_SCHMA